MDGMSFFQSKFSQPADDAAPAQSIRTAALLTVVSVVLTLGVLIGLGLAGAPLPIASEIATAPVAW